MVLFLTKNGVELLSDIVLTLTEKEFHFLFHAFDQGIASAHGEMILGFRPFFNEETIKVRDSLVAKLNFHVQNCCPEKEQHHQKESVS